MTKPFETILSSLRNTDQPMLTYLWQAWLISWPPSIIILGITSATLAHAAFGTPHDPKGAPPLNPLVIFIVSWAVQVLVMGAILQGLQWLIRKPLLVASISAVIWGFLCGLIVIEVGVALTWTCFVCSVCFLAWEKKSQSKAILMTSLLLLCNYSATALMTLLVPLL